LFQFFNFSKGTEIKLKKEVIIKNPNGVNVVLKNNEDLQQKTYEDLKAEIITLRTELIRLNNLYRELTEEESTRKQICENALKQRELEVQKK
jgi:ribosomal protein L29